MNETPNKEKYLVAFTNRANELIDAICKVNVRAKTVASTLYGSEPTPEDKDPNSSREPVSVEEILNIIIQRLDSAVGEYNYQMSRIERFV